MAYHADALGAVETAISSLTDRFGDHMEKSTVAERERERERVSKTDLLVDNIDSSFKAYLNKEMDEIRAEITALRQTLEGSSSKALTLNKIVERESTSYTDQMCVTHVSRTY